MNVLDTRAPTTSDEGVAVVIVSLALIPLLAFAAMAVDFGSWYATGTRVHKAADAAALAGVVWLPDMDAATAVALATAARNGYDAADPTIDVVVERAGASSLQVTITDRDVPLYLSSLFVDDLDISRSATAEYIQSIPMGSPGNTLGNDPIAAYYPHYWMNVFQRNDTKVNGERFHTQACAADAAVSCSGGVNEEYDEDGYRFTVDVSSVQGASLTFDFFDIVHTQTDNHCTAAYLFADASTQPFYAANVKGLANYPPERYEDATSSGGGVDAALWCLGDEYLSGEALTTVIVREPDNTPFDPTDNPLLCWATFGPQVPDDEADFAGRLVSDDGVEPRGSWADASRGGVAPVASSLMFRETFREWTSVCRDTTPVVGEYLIQIRTNASLGNPLVPSQPTATGWNRFSLRAGFGDMTTNPSFGAGVSMAAEGRLPIFVNRPGAANFATTEFYLARVLPAHAGKIIELDVFDLTDGSDLDLSFQPDPSDPSANYSSFPDCDLFVTTPSGTVTDLIDDNCEATAASNDFNPGGLGSGQGNGSVVTGRIRLPADYTCDETNPYSCWVTVRMTFSSTPHDATTWSARLIGDPVHLTD